MLEELSRRIETFPSWMAKEVLVGLYSITSQYGRSAMTARATYMGGVASQLLKHTVSIWQFVEDVRVPCRAIDV